VRHFVFQGKAHSPGIETPEIVSLAAQKIKSPFFSVDTIRRKDGEIRIVELGDGQVSDRKSWTAAQFLKIFKS
jgi:acetoacetate decarboxylase